MTTANSKCDTAIAFLKQIVMIPMLNKDDPEYHLSQNNAAMLKNVSKSPHAFYLSIFSAVVTALLSFLLLGFLSQGGL